MKPPFFQILPMRLVVETLPIPVTDMRTFPSAAAAPAAWVSAARWRLPSWGGALQPGAGKHCFFPPWKLSKHRNFLSLEYPTAYMKERNAKAGKSGWWYPQKILEIWVQYMQFVKHCKAASLLLSAGSSGSFEACGTTCTVTSSLGGIGWRCFEWGIGVFQKK